MSRERIFQLADEILAKLKESGVKITDSRRARSAVINALTEESRFIETLDAEARDRISRMKRRVIEGTGEWQALYEKFFMEAFHKRVRI